MDTETKNLIQQLKTRVTELENNYKNLQDSSKIPMVIENALVNRGFLKYDSDLYYEAGAGGNAFHDIIVRYLNVKFNLNIPNPLRIFYVNVSTNICTSPAHGFADGNTVNLYTTNTLPSGLDNPIMTYAILNPTDNTFQLTTDGVNPVDITSAGVGVHYAQAY